MSSLIRRSLAEAVGTFVIVFAPVALSAIGKLSGAAADLSTAAWVSGLAVLAMVYALGHISMAHFNPAVTVAFAAAKRFPWRDVPAYIGSQLIGAIAAAGVVTLLFGVGQGVHIPRVGAISAVAIEIILSFFLMLTIMATATDRRAHPAFAGTAIGLVVVLDVLIGGAATGGSMNPARSLAPAIFAGGAALANLWIYLIAPPIGAILGAFVYEALRGDSGCDCMGCDLMAEKLPAKSA